MKMSTMLSRMSSHTMSLVPNLSTMYLLAGNMSVPKNFRRPSGNSMYMTGFRESSCASEPCSRSTLGRYACTAAHCMNSKQVQESMHAWGVLRTMRPAAAAAICALMLSRYLRMQRGWHHAGSLGMQCGETDVPR